MNTIPSVITAEQMRKAHFILSSPYAKLSSLSRSELKDLAVVWCYYSGKIEGNTYTFVETEALIKDGITSEKRYEDAKMLKNLYNIFVSEVGYITQTAPELIDDKLLLRVHGRIAEGLISDEDLGQVRDRAVAISGTSYRPPKHRRELMMHLSEILYVQDLLSHPLEQAIYLHCNIARLQPFIDGNKRTARLIEAICLMNHGLIPVYSAKDADILAYRRGLIAFYESGDYGLYTDYFLDRQIERINEIADENERYVQ